MKKIEFYGNKNVIFLRMREARTRKGLSQHDLAAKLQTLHVNIDQQMISKIETNCRQVTDFELACICKCLDVSPEWLLGDYKKFMR